MDDQRPHGSTDQPITRQCTARSKRSGERCRKHAMRGRPVCLAHGGRTPRGAASPHFKTGRYSRSLPGHLVGAYEEARRDPRLLSLRDEIALTDAMINEQLRQLDEGISASEERRAVGQIRTLIEQRRKLVEAEVKHVVLARQVMTLDETTALLNAIAVVVTRYVPDRKDRAAISEEIVELIDSDSNTPLGAHSIRMPDDSR